MSTMVQPTEEAFTIDSLLLLHMGLHKKNIEMNKPEVQIQLFEKLCCYCPL